MMRTTTFLAMGFSCALLFGNANPVLGSRAAAMSDLTVPPGTTYSLPSDFVVSVEFRAKKVTLPGAKAQYDAGRPLRGPWKGVSEPEKITADLQEMQAAMVEHGTLHEGSDTALEEPALTMKVSPDGTVSFHVVPSELGFLTMTTSGDENNRTRRYGVKNLDLTARVPTVGDLTALMPREMNEVRLGIRGSALSPDATILVRAETDGSFTFLVGSS